MIYQDPDNAPVPLTDEAIGAHIDRVRKLRLKGFLSYFASDATRIDGALAYLRTLTVDDLLDLAAEDIVASNDALTDALNWQPPHGHGEEADTA